MPANLVHREKFGKVFSNVCNALALRVMHATAAANNALLALKLIAPSIPDLRRGQVLHFEEQFVRDGIENPALTRLSHAWCFRGVALSCPEARTGPHIITW